MKLRLLAFFLCAIALQVQAESINVVGLFPGKAVLVIDGKSPKTYSVGHKVTSDIKLISVDNEAAYFDNNGKRQRIDIGTYINHTPLTANSSVTLQADDRGHFVTNGQINGHITRMMVDTGASMISLSAADAIRLGIDYKKGQRAYVSTANGTVSAYLVKLNSVKVGDIVLNQVDGLVQETGLPLTLLGMSFLNRTEMQRNGEQMVLTKRY